jgi:23S rRNA pseudouridine2605 synthase
VHRDSRRTGLARALSKLGYCSRSRAAETIREGRVTLNGTLRRDPEFPTHPDKDRIAVDGVRVQPGPRIYLMMNKPRGLVTTASDEKGRQTVYSILQTEQSLPWVAPVGRLDKASEGLLLLTNDSEWAARVAAPQIHLEKIYHVQIAKVADEKLVHGMTKGIRTEDGEVLRVGQCRVVRSGAKSCWLEIVLEEGKNRHIRRMLEALDIEVLRLVRVAIGPLQLGKLAKGSFRTLMLQEKLALDHAMQSVKPGV